MSLRIAIADDEADMRAFLERMLPRCGYEVVSSAASGPQLVEDCRRVNPDLIISDIRMPGLDGLEASTRICEERPVPIILISAFNDERRRDRLSSKYIIAYLVKPIQFADLQPAITAAMQRFQEQQQPSP